MTTVRQIERLWNSRSYERICRDLLANRPESSLRLEIELSPRAAAAAIALIRLDELNQSHAPLCSQLIKSLISYQLPDGSWEDPMTTALCLRALLLGQGAGFAIERALLYFAHLQKAEGIWPNVPLRRMPADPYVSAFILYQLGPSTPFRSAVRFLDALQWFEQNEPNLDPESRRLWDRASLRCRLEISPAHLWS
jgi:hypothetical protein